MQKEINIEYKEAKDFEKSAFVVSLEEFRKLEKELNDLKKELDNSKFGSQCIIHELEYDKKTLIKDNEVLWSRLDKEMEAEQLLGAVIQIAEDLIEACGTIDPYKFAQKKKAQLDKIKANHSKL